MTVQEWLKDVKCEHRYLFSDDGKMVAEVRGWGTLQYVFKTAEEAAKFQDKVGDFIAEAINEKIDRLKQNKQGRIQDISIG